MYDYFGLFNVLTTFHPRFEKIIGEDFNGAFGFKGGGGGGGGNTRRDIYI
jgi:hypothetical protein